ncbi:hypothetical protein PYCC9005_004283 [Savitreella phatthalungensis]
MSTSTEIPPPGYETSLTYTDDRLDTLRENWRSVREAIDSAGGREVELIAVSKLKPASDILALHRGTGQCGFGENYVQELLVKRGLLAGEEKIRWWFIGGLQSNKCKQLALEGGSALAGVQTVDSAKKATELHKGRVILKEREPGCGRLEVYLQVNTSGEAEKSGVEGDEALAELARHVLSDGLAETLRLVGLMTIGSLGESSASGAVGEDRPAENRDFTALIKARDTLAATLDADAQLRLQNGASWKDELKLSMGMSQDFEAAIKQGADTVRVGTRLFGARAVKGGTGKKSGASLEDAQKVEEETAKAHS